MNSKKADTSPFEQLLNQCGLPHVRIQTRGERYAIRRQWLERFAAETLKTHKSYLRGFFWHCFSSQVDPRLWGSQAMRAYFRRKPQPFYIFSERCEECFVCFADRYPDFSNSAEDVYIFSADMKWTMVFTHEQSSDYGRAYKLGPFFAKTRIPDV